MENNVGSVIMAAGRGSRMKGYNGNKTLLPLIPGESPFIGKQPILINIIQNLPMGPKAIVVHHKKKDIIKATEHIKGINFYEQEILNGTGGALLAVKEFIYNIPSDFIIITMGDVPFVRPGTYQRLVQTLRDANMTVLAFRPVSKKQYGVLKINGALVSEIIEWKYWSKMPEEEQKGLELCNSGIYAIRRSDLIEYLPQLSQSAHVVEKEIGGEIVKFEEFFITDLVAIMSRSGKRIGYVIAKDEREVMGIDDLESLLEAQKIFTSQKP